MINTGTLKIAKIVKGDTFKETLTFYDSAGDPMDLSGFTVYMGLSPSPEGSVSNILQIDSTGDVNADGEITISGKDSNIVSIKITKIGTNKLTASANQFSYLDPKMQEMLNNPGFDYKQLLNKNIALYYRDIKFVEDSTGDTYTYLNGAVLVFRSITEIP